MKKFFSFFIAILSSQMIFSQSVGVGTSAPDVSALFDVTSTNKGVLIPRMSSSAIASIPSPARGLLVYDTAKNQLMVNMGFPAAPDWETVVAKSGWTLGGNAGINPATQFIGTTDMTPLIFKVNNTPSGSLDPNNANTSFGYSTLQSNTSGQQNIAFGFKSLNANTSGSGNVSVGSYSLQKNTTGQENVTLGTAGLEENTTGINNTAIGYATLQFNTSGNDNTAVGRTSLISNTTGNSNTALGSQALYANTTGSNNIAIGTSALSGSTNSIGTIAIGYHALASAIGTGDDVAIGFSSLGNNTNGYDNTAVGYSTLSANTSGYQNTAFGSKALFSNTTGLNNTAFGLNASVYATTASNNTALGTDAIGGNVSGNYNTAVGNESMYSNNDSYNTGVGFQTLYNTINAEYNTAIGYNAGHQYNLGYNNTILGANCDATANGLFNIIAIGQAVTCTASSQARIGNSATTSIGGYVGWSNISDGRFKTNVQENVKGLDFIMQLHPVTYQLDVQGISNYLNENRGAPANAFLQKGIQEKQQITYSGFIAQDVESVAKSLGYNFSGVDAPKNSTDLYSLRYADFVVPLVKGMQEQQKTIEDLQQRVSQLEQEVKSLLSTNLSKGGQ